MNKIEEGIKKMFVGKLYEKYKTKWFKEELEKTDCLYKYLGSENWVNLCNNEKKILVEKIFDRECEEIQINYPVNVKYFETKGRLAGIASYDEKTIYFNEFRQKSH